MSYPLNPASTGSLVVGYLPDRVWLDFAPGADGKVLVANSLATPFGLEWSDNLGVKTFESDLTLTDLGPGPETTVIRTSNTGATSIINSNASQQMYIGGHTPGSALGLTLVAGLHTIIPSSGRDLNIDMTAGRVLRIRHSAITNFQFGSTSNNSYKPFLQYDSTFANYGTINASSSGQLFIYGNHAQRQVYLATPGATNQGLWIRDDGADVWMETGSAHPNLNLNISGTGGQFTLLHNYGTRFYVNNTAASFSVPTTFAIADAVTAAVSTALTVQHGSTGTPAVGFGASMLFNLHDSTNVYRTAASWDVQWEDPVATTHDSKIVFRAITNGTYPSPNILELSGLNQQATVGGKLKVTGNVGFNNLGPIAIPTAYTQTYATATRTHANQTQATLTDSTLGTATTTIAAVSGTGDDTTINDDLASIVAQVNNIRADVANLKQLVNSLIDDGQAYGLLQ